MHLDKDKIHQQKNQEYTLNFCYLLYVLTSTYFNKLPYYVWSIKNQLYKRFKLYMHTQKVKPG